MLPVGAAPPPTPIFPPLVPEILLGVALVTAELARTPKVELDAIVSPEVAANDWEVSVITKNPEDIRSRATANFAGTLLNISIGIASNR